MTFTGLTSLSLWLNKGTMPTPRKAFLVVGASRVLVRGIPLGRCVPFSGLPQLLASIIDLVSLPFGGSRPAQTPATFLQM